MKPVIVIGGGGHAKLLIETLQLLGREVLGFTTEQTERETIFGVPYLGNDEAIIAYEPEEIELVNGVGHMKRAAIFVAWKERGYSFSSVIHPRSYVAPSATMAEGVQVMAQAAIQTSAVICENVIVNTNATVEHDCYVQAHSHIAPGATLCGTVSIGERTLVGANATVLPNLQVGSAAIVGAGAVVIRHLDDETVNVGNPTKS